MQDLSKSIIAVQDDVEECGAIVWWSLSSVIDIKLLSGMWEAAGLPEDVFPAPVSENAAFRRALADQQTRRHLVRPLKKRGHFAIVDESVDENEEISHRVSANVFLENGRVEVGMPDVETYDAMDRVEELQFELQRSMDFHMEHLGHSDVSYFLIQQANRLGALSLRDRGGMYFLPKEQLEEWRTIVSVLRSVSEHKVYEIPALSTDEAVEAILDSLLREVEGEVSSFEEALLADNLGVRALNNRVERAEGMREKIGKYAALLGKNLDELTNRVGDIEGKLAAAAILCMTAEVA